jgi:hypothetical protein
MRSRSAPDPSSPAADPVDTESLLQNLHLVSPRELLQHLAERGVDISQVAVGTTRTLTAPSVGQVAPPLLTDVALCAFFVDFVNHQMQPAHGPVVASLVITPVASSVPPASSSVSGLCLPDPPYFEGDPSRLETWVAEVATYLRASGVDLQSSHAVGVG